MASDWVTYNSVNLSELLNFYMPQFRICHSSIIGAPPPLTQQSCLGMEGDDPATVPGAEQRLTLEGFLGLRKVKVLIRGRCKWSMGKSSGTPPTRDLGNKENRFMTWALSCDMQPRDQSRDEQWHLEETKWFMGQQNPIHWLMYGQNKEWSTQWRARHRVKQAVPRRGSPSGSQTHEEMLRHTSDQRNANYNGRKRQRYTHQTGNN